MSFVPQSGRTFQIGWIVLFAILAAIALHDFSAAWLGALVGYLFGRMLDLERRLDDLQARLVDLTAQLLRRVPPGVAAPEAEVPQAPIEASVSEPPSVVVPQAKPSTISTPRTSRGWGQPSPSETIAPVPPIPPVPPMPEEPQPPDLWVSLGDGAEAWLKRGNPLARLGVVITFFGAVFLIKYAAEQGYLPIEWRLAGLSVAALAMVVVGWRLRDKASVYALTLQGGGLALLYLTVLGAFRFYHLLSNQTAIALLVAVAAASAWLAVRQNALALAVIGFSGGFVAPLLIGGSGDHIALFGYYTVLNLGVFAIAAYRAWGVLNLLGFVFTFVITALWRATAYKPELFASTEFFLLLFFALYVAVTVLNARKRAPDLRSAVSGTLTFGLPAIVLSLQATIVQPYEYGLAWSAFGFGLFYLLLAAVLYATRRETLRLPVQAFIAIGVVLLSLAVPLRYDDHATAATWALEGAGAVWLGVRQDQRRARFFGVLIQLLAGVSLMLGLREGGDDPNALLAAGVPGGLLLAVAGLASGAWLYRHREQLAGYETNWDRAAALWGTGWWLYAGGAQIDHVRPDLGIGLLLVYAAGTAVLHDLAGARLAWRWLRTLALGVLVLLAVPGLFEALDRHPLAHAGAFGWLASFAALYALLWRRESGDPLEDEMTQRALHVGALWLLTLLIGLEVAWQLRLSLSADWTALAYGLVPTLTLALLALRQPRWPVAAHDETYRLWAAAPIAVWLLLWIVVTSLSNAGDAAPLPTLPLLNPLDLSIVFVLAAIAAYWRSLGSVQRVQLMPPQAWLLPAVAAAVIFVWLNSALVRGFHYGLGTPLDTYGIRHSALLQAAFSIFWGGLGFGVMLLAARRHWRMAWLAGAGLMVIVAIKLFVVDTAGTGTLARIAAFLIVGALLLITGYLAPLPPARKDTEPEAAH